MRLFFTALLALAFIATAPIPPKIPESIVTVSFNIADEPDAQRRCTGFQISINAILTAAHCVDAKAEMFVDGKPTHIIKVNDAFALLEVPPLYKPLLTLGKMPQRGDELWAWGHAYGEDLLVYHRYVAGYNKGHLITDGTFSGGMSGGPVIDNSGKVVGVIQAGNDVVGIVCTVEELRDFLK